MTSSPDVDRPVGHAVDVIDLRVPADPAYLAVIRTATAGVATRLDLTLDEIEDLRIAVDEACALLLDPPPTEPGDAVGLHALFSVNTADVDAGGAGRLVVRLTGPRSDQPLDTGYPWMLLRALVDEVSTGLDASGRWIALTHRSSAAGPDRALHGRRGA